MTRRIDQRQSLVGLVRSLIRERTGPQATPAQLAAAGAGVRYVLPQAAIAADGSTVMLWTRRRLELDLGAYITPAPDYFEDLVTTEGVFPAVNVYASTGGNIGHSATLAAPYFVTYSGEVYVSTTRVVRLRLNTAASAWLGVDGLAVLASDGLAPNQATDAVFELTPGTHTIELGIYQQSGTVAYELTGNLAAQVDKVGSAPDRTPPQAPPTPVLTIVAIPPALILRATVTPATYEADVALFRLYRAKNASATPPALTTFDLVAELPETTPGAGVVWQEVAELGAYYHVFAVAVDTSGNASPGGEVATILATETGRPGSVSGVTLDGSATGPNGPQVTVTGGTTLTLAWTDPADADFDHVNVYHDTIGGKVATAWDQSVLISTVAKGVGLAVIVHGLGPQTSTKGRRYFLQTVDAYGNVDVDHPDPGSLYPGGAYALLDMRVVEADAVLVAYHAGNEPNALGWRNASTQVDIVYLGEKTLSGLYFYSYNPVTGDVFYSQLANFVVVTAETGTDGEVFSGFAGLADGTYSGTGALRLRIDKSAPSACTSLAAVQEAAGVLRITWTDGADSISGLQGVKVYRARESTSFGDAVLVGFVKPGVQAFNDPRVDAWVRYTYWVAPVDNADNETAAGSSVIAIAVGAGAFDYVNWIDNSSHERGLESATGWAPTNWRREGTWSSSHWGTDRPPIGWNGSKFPSLTADRQLWQDGLPLLGASLFVSLYARRVSSGTPTPRVRLVFKDISGATVQTTDLDFAALADSDAWSRCTLLASSGLPIVGPVGSSAPITYPVAARTVDVGFLVAGTGGVNVDGLMLQEVVTEDAGTTWLTLETRATPPSTWVDSRVFVSDRVMAYIGRFLEVYAGRVSAGTLATLDGRVLLDLDNSTLTLEDTREAGFYPSLVTLNGDGIKREQWNGEEFAGAFWRGVRVDLSGESADGVVSGEVLLIDNLEVTQNGSIFEYLVGALPILSGAYIEAESGYIQRSYPIGLKASSTDPGAGALSLRTERIGSTYTVKVFVVYSCYIRAASYYAIELRLKVGAAWYDG